MSAFKKGFAGLGLALMTTVPAFAHVADIPHQHSFIEGVLHPLSGLDHLLAMLAIGFWAAQAGGAARWVWPVTFVSVAGFATVVAQSGYMLPAYEPLIALSVMLLGLIVYAGLSLPIVAGALLSGAAAFVHGFAHGAEMPIESDITTFISGFLITTALLHAAGLMIAPRLNDVFQRIAGGFVATCGALLLAATF